MEVTDRPAHPHKAIWAIAGPAIVANSSAPLVGLVDTWVIGHMPGAQHLAAIGVGAMVFSYIFWAFGFLRMSTTGLVAQAFGKDDADLVAQTIVRSLLLGLLIALGLVACQALLFGIASEALDPPGDVNALFRDYFMIRIWSAPAVLAFYSINGYLIGVAKAKKALKIHLLLNISNGALNLLFVLGLGLGVKGIAFGSLIAEWLAAAAGMVVLARSFGPGVLARAASHAQTYAAAGLKKLVSTNGYIFVRTLLLMTALTLVTRKAGLIGEAPLAASHVMTTFMMLISLGLDGFAYAAEALSGAAYGKGARGDFSFWVRNSTYWALAAAAVYTLAFALFGDGIVHRLTDIEAVRTEAASALPVMVALPLVAVWCYQFDGIYIGATAGAAMMVTMAIAFGVFIAVVDWLTNAYGLMGLWLALLIFVATRGAAQAAYYPRLAARLGEKA